MELQKLQQQIYQNKVNRGFNTTDIGKEIILMTEELGELARAYKNSDKKPAKEISNKDEIIDAVGDMMVYCLGLCAILGADSEQVLQKIAQDNETREHTEHM
ncbi:hypothetical protein KJ969_00595 [Patescibacteria group bacterium]|nr:hypothetical protein [Patescibacteria group bacterium]MBU1922405.1 hypothetical protein [Patescibacteria group bacterium]